MRLVALAALLVACQEIPANEVDPGTPPLVVNAEPTGEQVPALDTFVRGVVAFAPESDAAYPFAFNGSGIPVGSLPQLPAMTPFLPRPVDEVSLELLDGDGAELASSGEQNLDDALAEVVLYGDFEDPRGLSLGLDEAPVTPGSLAVRLVHVTPGLEYAGFGPRQGAPVIAAFEEDTSPWVVLDADRPHTWFLDVNGDGAGDVPYTSWELPATDALVRPQVVDIFVVPSGSTLPPPSPPLPVPILVITPLTAPEGVVTAVPALGGG